MWRKLALFLFLIAFLACNKDFHTLTTKQFSIRLPVSLISFKGQMLDSALLEYADTARSIYVIVEQKHLPMFNGNIDSAREQLVDFYLIDDALPNSFNVTKLGKGAQMIEAETAVLEPDLSSTQTYWVVGFFKSDSDHYYVVWTWTNRIYKPDNEQTLKKIVESFKLKRLSR